MAAAEGELRIWKVRSWLGFSEWWWRWLASSTSTPKGSLRMTPMVIRCYVQLQSIWMLISKEYSFSPWMVKTTMQIVKNHTKIITKTVASVSRPSNEDGRWDLINFHLGNLRARRGHHQEWGSRKLKQGSQRRSQNRFHGLRPFFTDIASLIF